MDELLKYIKDPAMIIGIIGITEVVKAFFPGVKSKKFIILVPLILGLGAGIAMFWGDPKTMIWEGLKYAGFASLAYQFYRAFFVKDGGKNVKTN